MKNRIIVIILLTLLLSYQTFSATLPIDELGHFLGMRHYDNSPCLMNSAPDSVNHLQQTRFIDENYRYFKPGK